MIMAYNCIVFLIIDIEKEISFLKKLSLRDVLDK